MRILTIVTEAPPVRSGVATVVDRLSAGLRLYGHELTTVTVADVGRRELGEVRITGFVRKWPAVRAQLEECDVVHLHGPAPTLSDAFLALWRTVPRKTRPSLVYTHHADIDIAGARSLCAIYNVVHRGLARAASHVVVSTESYRRLAARHDDNRVVVIPFGVDPIPPRAQVGAGPLVVVFLGQLRPYKGADVVIRAAAQLPDIRFHVAGSGHQEGQLRALADELGVTNLSIHGAVSDEQRAALLQGADVVVLPSLTRAEAFGLVLLEGMSAGAVPVASDLPGVRDVAGTTGLLVRPGSVRSLIQALCHLRDDPDDLRRRRLASIENAERYTWRACTREYHRVLADAVLTRHLRASGCWSANGALSLMRDAALADRASLMLYDTSFRRMRLVAVSGRPLPIPSGMAGSDMDSFAGRSLSAGQPYVVSADTNPIGHLTRPEAHAGLCVPFSVVGAGIGVVSLTRFRTLDFLPGEVGWMSKRIGEVMARIDKTGLQPASPDVADASALYG